MNLRVNLNCSVLISRQTKKKNNKSLSIENKTETDLSRINELIEKKSIKKQNPN